jgi:uncharacterized membrane protein
MMKNSKFSTTLKKIFSSFLAIALVFTLIFSTADSALAARSGGRIGGGSFSRPSRSYSAPGGGYRSPVGGYGGGMGFPFLIPFFGFGGGFGGLFTIFIVIALANFLVKSLKGIGSSEEDGGGVYSDPKVSVAQVQVGLLAQARDLQKELNVLANKADTGTASGRAMVLQEATLALLRHPEYWYYGSTYSQQTALSSAEAKFNQLALGERSKFTSETLSNVNSQLKQTALNSNGEIVLQEDQLPGEYIIVTLVAGVEGKLDLPKINGSQDMENALRQIGGVGSDRLLAVEILWTPQAEGDTLSNEDIMAQYPNLKLV